MPEDSILIKMGSNMQWAKLTIWVHDDRFSSHPLLVSPDLFPPTGIAAGDLILLHISKHDFVPSVSTGLSASSSPAINASVEASAVPEESRTEYIQKMLVKDAILLQAQIIAKPSQLQISLHASLATRYRVQARTDVWAARGIKPESVQADYVELTFRDQVWYNMF